MKELEQPLISVIVPIYNVEQYLPRCIESILNQTYKNLEIILVDDGATDRCGSICDAYKEKDCRVKVIHNKKSSVKCEKYHWFLCSLFFTISILLFCAYSTTF